MSQAGQLPSFKFFSRLPTELRLKIWQHALPGPRIVEIFVRGYNSQYLIDATARPAAINGNCLRFYTSWNTEDVSVPSDLNLGTSALGSMDEDLTSNGVAVGLDATSSDDDSEDGSRIYTSQCKIPVILHVCRESREVALRFYKLRFGTARSTGRVYFNNDIDILLFPGWSPPTSSMEFERTNVDDQLPNNLAGIRKLAWVVDAWYGGDSDFTNLINGQIEPLEFPDLEELILISTPSHPNGQCGCCQSLQRPAILGTVEFVDVWRQYRNNYWIDELQRDSMAVLDGIQARNPKWKRPTFQLRSITRDGVLTYM